jgi:hypothetical protein
MCFKDEDPVSPMGGTKPKTKAMLVRSEDFDTPRDLISTPMLTIYLYRVEVNRITRPGWSGVGYLDGQGHLPLDLHFLITPWGDNAEDEYKILGKSMQCMEQNPILTGPLLFESGGASGLPPTWGKNDAVQVVTDELAVADISQIFDSLQRDYKLSVGYLARVVRIDTSQGVMDTPVTTIVRGAVPSSTP